MLSENAFEHWCQYLNLSVEARTTILRIRSSPPSRVVRSSAGNVSGRYPSKKMGCSIQYESHKNELPFIYHLEHDPSVLEFYDQPEKIKLIYQNKEKTRRVVASHTPDFFVLHDKRAGWVECKMEEDLLRLAEQNPHRYVHHPDGSWSCPPGEAYAAPLGLFYQIRSSCEIDWITYRNLRFLQHYLRGSCSPVLSETVTAIRTSVVRHPGMALLDLLQTLQAGAADDVYQLIVRDQLYVDLEHSLLEEPESVQVFPDRQVALAHATMKVPSSLHAPLPPVQTMSVGTPLWWDGKPWTVFNPGMTAMTLLSEDQQLKEISNQDFETLLREGKVTGLSSETEAQGQARMLLDQASPKDLEVALQRYRALGNQADGSAPSRTLRRWRASFHEAQILYGNGFVGLLPLWKKCGNRTQRLSDEQEKLLETFIANQYETLKQQPMWEVYLLLQREAEQQKPPIPVPSYSTFTRRIAQRPRVESTLKRQGKRAATQVERWYWELEQKTPRHGGRPEEIVHIDHTLLDIELVSSRTGHALGRPWCTFMIDAFSRRLLVVYLTFDEPSYRSGMMALREYVWRYGRLPQTVIVDGGSDFRSTYFETLLAYYDCTKATRPWAKPHYGSVCERLFGTANTQFVHNLIGNTQIMKQVRQVTRSMQPREQAVWTLGDLYAYLCEWAYEVYDTSIHPALGQSPREAFKAGQMISGKRDHLTILYQDDFRFLSLATTRKKVAKVEPGRGVKINYLYYWSEALLPKKVEETTVPVRYDPFDVGTAYAYVEGRWVKCQSEYYSQLHGHSERELQMVSHELRKRFQNHRGQAAITAKRLADLLAQASAHEEILTQRRRDLEARDVFARMGGPKAEAIQEQTPAQEVAAPSASSSSPPPATVAWENALGDDDEELEEYEEYR
jgi:transposase InsO family protein